jgi:hypothetical protein
VQDRAGKVEKVGGNLSTLVRGTGKVAKVGGNLSTLVRGKAIAALPNDGADKADEPRDGDLCCGAHFFFSLDALAVDSAIATA